MNNADRLRELLLLPRHLREQPEVVAAIREAITQDDAALRHYVQWMQFESNLHWVLQSDESSPPLVVSELRKQVWRIRLFCISAASVLVLMVAAGFHFYATQKRAPHAPMQAALLEANSAVAWTRGEPRSGRSLREGDRLTALEGHFLLRMQCGAVVACEGPIDIEIKDSWEVFLHHGTICVRVPPRAQGFRARCEVGTVVDLGTVFAMRVSSDRNTEVQVLEGAVEISSTRSAPQTVLGGFAQTITSDGTLTPPTAADSEAFRRQLAALIGVSSASNTVHAVVPPPASVETGGRPTASTAGIILEQSAVVTTEPLTLYDARPGTYTEDHIPEEVVIPPGTAVTTYLIHAENTTDVPVDGELTFDAEILGLALSTDQLDSTDAAYGHPEVLYPNEKRRRTLISESDDMIQISEDRRTLRLHISCSIGGFDQFRVFVHASQPTD